MFECIEYYITSSNIIQLITTITVHPNTMNIGPIVPFYLFFTPIVYVIIPISDPTGPIIIQQFVPIMTWIRASINIWVAFVEVIQIVSIFVDIWVAITPILFPVFVPTLFKFSFSFQSTDQGPNPQDNPFQ